MKKIFIRVFVALIVIILCLCAVQLAVGLESAAFSVMGAVPFVSAGMMAVMCYNYGRYPKKAVGMNAGSDRLNEKERTLMYHSLASALAYFIIPDLFLVIYFPSIVKIIGGILLFIAGVYFSTSYARSVTNRAFKIRIEKEGVEVSSNADNTISGSDAESDESEISDESGDDQD